MDLAYLAHLNYNTEAAAPCPAFVADGGTWSNTSSQFPGHPSAASYDNDTKWGLPEVPTRNDLDAAHHRLRLCHVPVFRMCLSLIALRCVRLPVSSRGICGPHWWAVI